MTLPILFKPGDILTAEQINNYLVERPEKQAAAVRGRIQPRVNDLTSRIEVLHQKAEYKQQQANQGAPIYDYEENF